MIGRIAVQTELASLVFLQASGARPPWEGPVDPAQVSKAILEGQPVYGSGSLMLSAGCLLVGAAVLLGLWLYRHRDRYPIPRLPFLQLARAMGLSPWQAFRLWRVSRRCRLPTPIVLMLCPATFDHHVAAWRDSGGHGALAAIRARLFPPDGGWIGNMPAEQVGQTQG